MQEMHMSWAFMSGLAIVAFLLGLAMIVVVARAVCSFGVGRAILATLLGTPLVLVVLMASFRVERRVISGESATVSSVDLPMAAAKQPSCVSVKGRAKVIPLAEHAHADVLPTAEREPISLETESSNVEEDGPDAELAPEMGEKVEIDFEARPAWVDRPDVDVGDVHYSSVASGPFLRPRDASRELDRQLKGVVDEYINELVGHPHASRWVGYAGRDIRGRFVALEGLFHEQVRSPSFGVMHQSHALLEFGPAFHAEVEQAWHHVVARARLVQVALAGATLLGMLTLLFAYFRTDTATRGSYTNRLKLVTAVAILAVIAAGCLIARSTPWLWL